MRQGSGLTPDYRINAAFRAVPDAPDSGAVKPQGCQTVAGERCATKSAPLNSSRSTGSASSTAKRRMPERIGSTVPFLSPRASPLSRLSATRSTLRGERAGKSQSEHPQFTLYRCTQFVTYTGSPLFAMGYAFYAVIAPPRVANSRGLKPLRTAYRGPPRVFAPGILNRLTRSDGCRGSLSLSPGGGERPRRRRAPGAEFALVNDHLLLFAIGRERTRAFSILVLISGLTRLLATT